MKASELRIGNYIAFMEDDSIAKVIGIHTKPAGVDVDFGDEETYIGLDQFSPIPVTEKKLFQSGFEWDIPTQKYCNGNWCVRLNQNGTFDFSYIKTHNKFFNFYFWAKPKYLHQLQNIFFLMNNNELDIDLQKKC